MNQFDRSRGDVSAPTLRLLTRLMALLVVVAPLTASLTVATSSALADPPVVVSPEVVHTGTGPTGYTVTFRFYDGNPATTNVKIRGEWYLSDSAHTTRSTSAGRLPTAYLPGDFPIANPNNGAAANWPIMPMTQDPVTLVWSFTTPLPPGTWTYAFLRNCANNTMNSTTGCPTSGQISDPHNPPWNTPVVPPAATEPNSEVYVPADLSFGTTDFSWQAPNPVHSTLADVTYPSALSTNPVGFHALAVCTPPGYDPSRPTPYPTLYLSHGAGGNEVDWSTQGVACNIVDNTFAAAQIQPMVVVMTNFNSISGGVAGYSTDVLGSVIPYVESHYNVLHGAANRAFGGLSAGGQRGNDLLFNHTDQFGYYGIWSNAGGTPADTSTAWSNPALHQLLGLDVGAGFFDSIGTNTDTEEARLTSHGVPFVDDSLAAGHEWYTWRIELRHFLRVVAFRHTTTTASGPTTTVYGQPATFSAAVASDTTEPAVPSGPVSFYRDGVVDAAHLLGTASLDGTGHAQIAVSTLPAGSHTVTAVYGGDSLYNTSTSAVASDSVTPAPLTVTADDQSRLFGAATPPLTATITGFVLGETLATSGVGGLPACTTTATQFSPVGGYPITCTVGTLTAANYSFATFVPGTLTVLNSTAGKADGKGLKPANGGKARFHVDAGGPSGPTGHLSYEGPAAPKAKPGHPKPPPPLHFKAKTITAFAIAPDGKSAWFAGTAKDGTSFLAYVEDSSSKTGPKKPNADVFQLWIGGVQQTGDGSLDAGKIDIHLPAPH